MLPSTGLFKSVLCPYYDSSESRCLRPYCHYKHATKKDEEPEQPVYIPTQKIEPPKLLTLGEPLKKKSKLEYIPTKPQINDAPQTKNYAPNSDNVPVYIPSNKININLKNIKNINLDLDDCTEELDMISEVISAEFSEPEDDNLENANHDNSSKQLDNQIIKEQNLILVNSKQEKDNKSNQDSKIISKENNHHKLNGDVRNSIKKEDRRHRTSSSSSSSRHKKSSKSEKDYKEISSEKDHKTSREKSTKHLSSSSSNSKPKSSSSHHSSKSSHKSSTREKTSSNHKSSSKSSSSSSSKSKSSISKEKETDISKNSIVNKLPSIDLKIESSDEEDIEAQCKLIFEQFKPKVVEQPTSHQQENSNKNIQKRKCSTEIDETNIEDVSKRKRIAHENPNNNYVKYKADIAPPPCRPNHMQNAVRSVHDRQEKAAKDHEEKKAVALAIYREAEEKLREAKENLIKTSDIKLTPLVPKSHLIASKPSFLNKPISNFLALERARKKVEEINKQKGPTLAQSAIKGSGRIAHRPPILPAATITKNNNNLTNNNVKTKEIVSRPAPPVLESKSTKISYNIRMQNYNAMVKYCLDIYPTCEDAWDRAQTEELAVFKKCSTPNIYRSSAIMTINKLRKESIAAGNVCTDKNKTISHELILAGKAAQNVSWGIKKTNSLSNNSSDPFERLSSSKIYGLIVDLILSEEQLIQNGFPRSGKRRGSAIIKGLKTVKPIRNDERFCERCSKIFNLSMYDTDSVDECNYHPKGTGFRRGFVDNFHRCCQQPAGTPGCTYGNYHVSNYIDPENLSGFVTTIDKNDNYIPTKKDIFALDCEMCYTTHGIELTRITVVDFDGKVIYDALVKPDNKIVDYNTTFSGITEKLLENVTCTIRDVQAILLSMFHSKSILIGHSLESDLKTLKLIHSVVVDTSVLFPHKMGPPKKRALKTLCIENLKRIIQEDESGHNSAEDAEVCIQLVKYYLRNRLV